MSSDNFESNDVTLSEQTYAHIAHDNFYTQYKQNLTKKGMFEPPMIIQLVYI